MAGDLPAGPTFASVLRRFRERAGHSQSGLARLAKLDASFVNRLESGQRGAERAVAEALIAALELPPEEADQLLAAGGYLPPSLAKVGIDDPTLRLVVQILSDDTLSDSDRAAFRRAVEAARQGTQDRTLQLVARILGDSRLAGTDREEFRQVIELIGRRWRSADEDG